jgi:hypothetical protein
MSSSPALQPQRGAGGNFSSHSMSKFSFSSLVSNVSETSDEADVCADETAVDAHRV